VTFAILPILWAADPAAKTQPEGGSLVSMLPFLLAIGVLFWFMLIRPQRQEQARRQSLLSALKKNDRVLTTSGIYGIVNSVDREADEVTIKVDETSNTKLRVTLGSIAQVLGDAAAEDNASK
jgi:preprotein translocase subunit YajC